MSNGIGPNPLNDISKVYLDQIVEKKKDDTYLEPDMKKRQANNEKARKELAKGPQMKNPHFEENQQGWDAVNSLADAYKRMHEGIRDEDPEKGTKERKARLEKKRGMKMDDHPQYQKEGYGAPGHNPGSGEKSVARAKALMDKQGRKGAPGLDAMAAAKKEHEARRGVKKEEVEVEEGYDEPKMHSAVKRVMTTQPAAKGRAASRLHSKYSMRSKGNVAGETDGPGPNAPKRSGRKGRGSETDRGSGNAAKRRMSTEALDPVGKEDGDVNNDGKKDGTDKYLMNRRKAIGKAIKKKMSEQEEKIGGGNLKKLAGKATKRVDSDVDGDVDHNDPKAGKYGEFVPSADGKKRLKTETYSWRRDLSEIMTDDIDSKPIKEKKVSNKIKINPKLGESIEEIGGELIEMVEINEYEFMVEGLRQELIDEGHDPEAVNYALEEATVTMGHDTPGKTEGTRDKLKKKAKGLLGKMAYKGYHAARSAKRALSPAAQRIKTSAKRGIRKAALKVADKLKEENVDEAVYGGTKKPAPTDNRLTVTNADKKGNTPAYQRFKAGDKRYKAADHMNEVYKGKHGQSDKEYADSRSPGGKMVSGDSKGSGAEYTHGRRVKAANPGMQPDVGGKTKPKSQGKMDAGTRADLEYRKANLKKEEMSTQEVALQKRKANIDQMIAKRRTQELDKGKAPTKTMGEEASDAMKDRRMERGGVGGNVDYKRTPKFAPGPSKKKYDGMSALDAVKAEIRKKHGKGAIIDTKKK